MSGAASKLVVLLDEGTPVMAADAFLARGHEVIFHADVLDSGADDDEVVIAAISNRAALIAVDLDMKRPVRRFGSPNTSESYSSLHLIFLSCGDVLASKRLSQAMTFIENEWLVAGEKASRRMWVDIGPHRSTSCR